MQVVAFSGQNATGSVLKTIDLRYNVIAASSQQQPPPPVNTGARITGLTLMNADTDKSLFAMTANGSLSLSLSAMPKLTVRAETTGTIGSVKWQIDGKTVRTENFAPWAIGGDANGGADLLPYAFPTGTHTMTAIAYSGADAGGSLLNQLSLVLNITP
jgi:hypothetical protein